MPFMKYLKSVLPQSLQKGCNLPGKRSLYKIKNAKKIHHLKVDVL